MDGRGTSDALARLPVDLLSLTNLNRMANTPDPRDFYGVSRVFVAWSKAHFLLTGSNDRIAAGIRII